MLSFIAMVAGATPILPSRVAVYLGWGGVGVSCWVPVMEWILSTKCSLVQRRALLILTWLWWRWVFDTSSTPQHTHQSNIAIAKHNPSLYSLLLTLVIRYTSLGGCHKKQLKNLIWPFAVHHTMEAITGLSQALGCLSIAKQNFKASLPIRSRYNTWPIFTSKLVDVSMKSPMRCVSTSWC